MLIRVYLKQAEVEKLWSDCRKRIKRDLSKNINNRFLPLFSWQTDKFHSQPSHNSDDMANRARLANRAYQPRSDILSNGKHKRHGCSRLWFKKSLEKTTGELDISRQGNRTWNRSHWGRWHAASIRCSIWVVFDWTTLFRSINCFWNEEFSKISRLIRSSTSLSRLKDSSLNEKVSVEPNVNHDAAKNSTNVLRPDMTQLW